MNALLRWETSITDMPLDFQSVISAWAVCRTSRGSVAGPAAKLNTRIVLSSGTRPSCRTRIAPGRYCPGARTISGGGRVGRPVRGFWVAVDNSRCGTARTGLLPETFDAFDARQSLALTQPDEAHALRIAAHDRDLA